MRLVESIRPTACQFRANESDGFIPISFERLIPSGDDPSKLPEFTISLKVIGGTASRKNHHQIDIADIDIDIVL